MATIALSRQKEIDAEIDRMLQKTSSSYPEDTLLDITNRLGINVYVTDFGVHNDEIRGIVRYKNGNEASIQLNTNHGKTRQTFTLAHELGHYWLHKNQELFYVDKYNYAENTDEAMKETEANYFASSLLMPKERFLKLITETEDTEAVANFFGVSEVAVRNRLRWVNLNN